MKPLPILPALLLPSLLLANHETITDAGGFVAPISINLTLNESVGASLLTQAKKDAAGPAVTYPDLTTFSTTYTPDATVSAIDNPFGWDTTKGNHYVERVTTDSRNPEAPVVVASGGHKVARSRYTNATLLADLVAAGKITSVEGYRIVAVRFDVSHEYHFMTAGGYNTHVNDHYYFYAEKGAADPDPVFLGAEYNDVYIYNQVVGITRVTEIKSGKYVDTFTGRSEAEGGGFSYALASLGYTKTAAGEFFFYRPTPSADAFYKITANGLFTWTEKYDKARNVIMTGAIKSSGLVGPAQGYFGVPDQDHPGTFHQYTPNAGNQAVVTGSIKTASAAYFESMLKYLNKIPNVMPH